MRLGLILVVGLAACSGSSKKKPTDPGAGSGSGSTTDPGVVARTLLGWGQQPATGGKVNLFLQVADHTGATRSYPIGDARPPCTDTAGAADSDIITTLRCVTDGVGAEFRAVFRNEIIVLRRAVDPSDNPDDIEFSFQEILRVSVPAGSKVGAAQ